MHCLEVATARLILVGKRERCARKRRAGLVIHTHTLRASHAVGENDIRVVAIYGFVHALQLFERLRGLVGDGNALARRKHLAVTHAAIRLEGLLVSYWVVRAHRKERVSAEKLRTKLVCSVYAVRKGDPLKHKHRLVESRKFNKRLALDKKSAQR